MHASIKDHWTTIKYILRYLQATTSYGLYVTRGSSMSLNGFTDANWANGVDNKKSTSGYLVYLGNTFVF